MNNTQVTYVVGGGSALIGLLFFTILVIVPAMTAYRRVWERLVVLVLSAYVLAALIGAGVLLGALIILEWPRFF
jgi:hypothetical protein